MILICGLVLIDIDTFSALADWGLNIAATYFELDWQVLLLATFLIGRVLCALPSGKSILGAVAAPEFTTFQWGSMIMCALLAGGVFRAAGERSRRSCWRIPNTG